MVKILLSLLLTGEEIEIWQTQGELGWEYRLAYFFFFFFIEVKFTQHTPGHFLVNISAMLNAFTVLHSHHLLLVPKHFHPPLPPALGSHKPVFRLYRSGPISF